MNCICLTKNQVAPDLTDDEWETFLRTAEEQVRLAAQTINSQKRELQQPDD